MPPSGRQISGSSATYSREWVRFGSFRQVLAEVLFIDTEPADGRYEPLLGYIPLEQAQAVVDLTGHRLAKIDRVDLKQFPSGFPNRVNMQ